MIRGARTGVFGGTFNPIHAGHLRAAEEVVDALALERMIFVPSASPPHKSVGGEDSIAPAKDRLEWVRAAISDNPRFAVDAVEIERGGASYTVDTLRGLSEQNRGERPVFCIGCDAFVEMGSWREPEVIFGLAHFAVTTRPPVTCGSLADWLPKVVRDDFEITDDGRSARHKASGCSLEVIEISALDISASDIRRRLQEGRSVRYLLPESIRKSVEQSGVYV